MVTSYRSLYRSYGVLGLPGLIKDYALTKLTWPRARLMRRPLYLRGTRWMTLGDGFTCGRGLRMEVFAEPGTKTPLLRIGSNVQMNDYVHIAAAKSVSIGDRVLIGSKVHITDHNHGCYNELLGPDDTPLTPPSKRRISCRSVAIEEDVWLGESVVVLPGVTIGKGAVVGALSAVTRDIPAYSIAIGSPARIIKRYNFDTNTWVRV